MFEAYLGGLRKHYSLREDSFKAFETVKSWLEILTGSLLMQFTILESVQGRHQSLSLPLDLDILHVPVFRTNINHVVGFCTETIFKSDTLPWKYSQRNHDNQKITVPKASQNFGKSQKVKFPKPRAFCTVRLGQTWCALLTRCLTPSLATTLLWLACFGGDA